MLSYEMARANARAVKADWNEEERISKAVITWADENWEYEQEIENEDMTDAEFEAWVEAHAEGFAKEAAAEENTAFEELVGIRYEYETIDDDARFWDGYTAYAELEWECRTGR